MNKLKVFIRRLSQVNITVLLLLVFFSFNLVVGATPADIQSLLEGTTFYDASSGCGQGDTPAQTPSDPANDLSANCACSDAASNPDASLSGSDNEEKTWNYFKAKGLSDIQTAGVMGNIEQESNFKPEDLEIGGLSQNPYDALGKGYGLIQWTGDNQRTAGDHTTADKFLGDLKAGGITGAPYLLGTQLDLIWGHMQNKPAITRGDFSVADFEKIADVNQATEYFLYHIEAGSNPGNIREKYAGDIYRKYSGQAASAGDPTASIPSDNCGATAAAFSPDCQSAVGVAKILCAAKLYNTVSYILGTGHAGGAAWHASCPTIGPSCTLDCSGLVNIAVYDVYKVDLKEATGSEATDTANWQHIAFSKLQPGDLIQPGAENGDHVAVVDHVTGSSIAAFSAHTSHVAQPDQVGPSTYTRSPNDLYLHYIGAGS